MVIVPEPGPTMSMGKRRVRQPTEISAIRPWNGYRNESPAHAHLGGKGPGGRGRLPIRGSRLRQECSIAAHPSRSLDSRRVSGTRPIRCARRSVGEVAGRGGRAGHAASAFRPQPADDRAWAASSGTGISAVITDEEIIQNRKLTSIIDVSHYESLGAVGVAGVPRRWSGEPS